MNDPRSKVFGALEGIAEGGAELKESLKAWIDNEVALKVAANQERDTAVTALAETKATVETLTTDMETLKSGDEANPRIADLESNIKALTEKYETAEAKAAELKTANDRAKLKSDFLSITNLKDEIAADKVELAIARGELLMQDGKAGGLVGGEFKSVAEFSQSLDESNSAYLKVVSGGKTGNYTSEGNDAPVLSGAEVAAKAVTQAGGSLPTFQ